MGPGQKFYFAFYSISFFFNFDLELQFDFKVRFGLILPLQFSHQVDKWRVLGAVLYFAFHSIAFFLILIWNQSSILRLASVLPPSRQVVSIRSCAGAVRWPVEAN